MSSGRPPGSESTYVQNVIEGASIPGGTTRGFGKIKTSVFPISQLDSSTLDIFERAEPLGLAAGYDQGGKLIALAISNTEACRIIDVSSVSKSKSRSESPLDQALSLLEDKILCRDAGELFAFDAGPIAVSVYIRLHLRITSLVDIQTAFVENDPSRKPLTAVLEIMGTEKAVYNDNVKELFDEPVYDPESKNCKIDLATRAWLAAFLPTFSNGEMVLSGIPRIDTKKRGDFALGILSKWGTDAHRQGYLSPMQTQHKFTAKSDEDGRIQARADIYKTKFHPNREVQVTVRNARGDFTLHGTIEGANGRTGSIKVDHLITTEAVTTVTSIGRDAPTRSDRNKAQLILHALQDKVSLESNNPWIQNIWFPDGQQMSWPQEWEINSTDLPLLPQRGNQARHRLNSSQLSAVKAMLSPSVHNSLILIQGPPGTGKTSVIANYVLKATEAGQKGIWLIAQSNVAVKNIAEKLLSVGFDRWKLLVSKDFHYQWHEHIYEKVKDRVIRSDRFRETSVRDLLGCSVILCTLSMLSNDNLSKFTKVVPFKSLIVDEASQIEIGGYMTVFDKFGPTLRKICFIGDDKQLPPHGQEDIQDLQSIFEVSHLKEAQTYYFLDTQYRMPPQLGEFISSNIYGGKLLSWSDHEIKDDVCACYFIDVTNGKESKEGDSFKNIEESKLVIKLGLQLQEQDQEYKVITPYDGQRNYIENMMKETEGFQWENKCFNVDSFQGNEEDYIILSLVRSREVGFLKNERRTNVMLTRCKKGMFIISSKKFLTGRKGSSTLVGQLAAYVSPEAWLTTQDVEMGQFGTTIKPE